MDRQDIIQQQASQGQTTLDETGPQVFICYAREDEAFARQLYADLQQAGASPWMACEDILPGQNWEHEIQQALRRSTYVLVLLSSHSISKRGYVRKEIKQALDTLEEFPPSQIYLIPVRLDDSEPLDERLHKIQWVDLWPASAYKSGLQRILQVVARKISGKTGEEVTDAASQQKGSVQQPSPSDRESSRDYFEHVGGNVYTGPVTIHHQAPEQDKQQQRPKEERKQPASKRDKRQSQQKSRKAPEKSPELETFSFETVTVNAKGRIIHREQGSAQQYIEELGSGVTLEMVYVPEGTFLMGSPEREKGRYDNEGPQHQVTVSSFFLGKYPVIQEQWKTVTGKNPFEFTGANHPIETVSWNEAMEFCRQLSEKTGHTYRLPTEAEWEYACRAGRTTAYYFGEAVTTELVNYQSEYKGTTEIGRFSPNAFGLYDMHGNVWEWCADWYDKDYYAQSPEKDPRGPASGSDRVIRGGFWDGDARLVRAACRNWDAPVLRSFGIGFRLVRTPS